MTALQDLLEKVERGEASTMAFEDAGFDGWAELAYHGSLDAARELHEAVLPGWKWSAHEPRPGLVRVSVSEWSPLRPMPNTAEYSIPARAWLIAILRALIAKEGE